MARPRKEGVAYFSLDVDFFSDKKIKILKARYGADGITLYIYLLCEIYKNGYYLEVDDDFQFIISDDLNMNCDKVKQIMTFLLERSLFERKLFQSDAVLTSAGIQRRFQLMVKSRASKNPIQIKDYWLLSKEETEPFIKVNSFSSNSENNADNSENNPGNNTFNSEKNDIKKSKEKESKEKENKVKKSVETAVPDRFSEPELEEAFQLFVTCRRQNDQKLSDDQIKLLREELCGLSNNVMEQLAIVKKATISNWKSFYPMKKNADGKKNKFNNFQSRDYDFGDMEKSLLGIK